MIKSQPPARTADVEPAVKAMFADLLGLPTPQIAALTGDSGLFGNLPEFDSMAIATLLTAIEDQFGFVIEDDELEPEMFETYGALIGFIQGKLAH